MNAKLSVGLALIIPLATPARCAPLALTRV